MTDRRAQMQRSKRRTTLAVYAITALLFALVTGVLGTRLAQGQDPAIGAGKAKVAQAQPRKVLVRKIVVTKRIVVEDPAANAAGAAVPASGGTAAPAAPPAAQAPVAPAPAPAPVATATS